MSFSKERRRKISEALKGRKFTPEHRENLRLSHLGKKQSAEVIYKRTHRQIGRKRPKEVGEKISRSLKSYRPKLLQRSESKNPGRQIIEQLIKRKLTKKEIVHHADSNHRNNNLDNLIFLRHQSAHLRIHHFAWRHKISTALISFKQAWLYG